MRLGLLSAVSCSVIGSVWSVDLSPVRSEKLLDDLAQASIALLLYALRSSGVILANSSEERGVNCSPVGGSSVKLLTSGSSTLAVSAKTSAKTGLNCALFSSPPSLCVTAFIKASVGISATSVVKSASIPSLLSIAGMLILWLAIPVESPLVCASIN